MKNSLKTSEFLSQKKHQKLDAYKKHMSNPMLYILHISGFQLLLKNTHPFSLKKMVCGKRHKNGRTYAERIKFGAFT